MVHVSSPNFIFEMGTIELEWGKAMNDDNIKNKK